MLTNEIKEWVKTQIRQRLANIIRYANIATSSADGQGDNVEGHTVEGPEDKYQYPVRRMEPFGLHSVPPEGLPACVVHPGGGASNAILLAVGAGKYFPAGLVAGEVTIYSKTSGCVIKMDTNGKITIDAPAGQDVVVNGGTLEVARDTDPTQNGALALQYAGTTATLLYVSSDGFTQTTVGTWTTAAAVTGIAALDGKITNGAARFKA